MTENSKRILVLSPHSDDMEISCGETVARFIDEGHEVFNMIFSFAEESIPEEFDITSTRIEERQAEEKLGTCTIQYKVMFQVRTFPSHRQEILDAMIISKLSVQPDIVLLPNSNDIHQDHKVIREEGIRAFRHSTILGYENIWNSMGKSNMTTYIPLTKEHIEKKIEAIECYKSQLAKRPDLTNTVKLIASIRGSEIGVKYAEVFQTIRSIV